jgi:hypothetical protein
MQNSTNKLMLIVPFKVVPSSVTLHDTLTFPLVVTSVFTDCAEILLLIIILIFMLLQAKQRRPKNRLPMKGEDLQRRSAFSIRLFLKAFCVEFLGGAYNTLMYHVKVSAYIYISLMVMVHMPVKGHSLFIDSSAFLYRSRFSEAKDRQTLW